MDHIQQIHNQSENSNIQEEHKNNKLSLASIFSHIYKRYN